jgi:hypothetical protein
MPHKTTRNSEIITGKYIEYYQTLSPKILQTQEYELRSPYSQELLRDSRYQMP